MCCGITLLCFSFLCIIERDIWEGHDAIADSLDLVQKEQVYLLSHQASLGDQLSIYTKLTWSTLCIFPIHETLGCSPNLNWWILTIHDLFRLVPILIKLFWIIYCITCVLKVFPCISYFLTRHILQQAFWVYLCWPSDLWYCVWSMGNNSFFTGRLSGEHVQSKYSQTILWRQLLRGQHLHTGKHQTN